MKAGHWSVPADAGRERRTRSETIIFHEARIWRKIPQVPGSPGRTFIWAAKGTRLTFVTSSAQCRQHMWRRTVILRDSKDAAHAGPCPTCPSDAMSI